jgi:hypothetical protein
MGAGALKWAWIGVAAPLPFIVEPALCMPLPGVHPTLVNTLARRLAQSGWGFPAPLFAVSQTVINCR